MGAQFARLFHTRPSLDNEYVSAYEETHLRLIQLLLYENHLTKNGFRATLLAYFNKVNLNKNEVT